MLPRAAFERRTTPRVIARACTFAVEGAREPYPVRDLSLEGVGLVTPQPLASGQRLAGRLLHPRLPALAIEVEVAWCRMVPGAGAPSGGGAFVTVSIAQRRALRRLLAAEAGTCLLAPGLPEDAPPAGYLLPAGAGAWLVLDAQATKLAYLDRGEGRFRVCQRGAQFGEPPITRLCADAGSALATALGLAAPPRLDPPPGGEGALAAAPASPPPPAPRPAPPAPPAVRAGAAAPPPPPPVAADATGVAPGRAAPGPAARVPVAPAPAEPPGPAPLAGHCVRDGGRIAGYVARTGEDVWSLYDDAMEQVGVLSRAAGTFTVFWLGETPESSVAFVQAHTFPEAVAIAFDLDGLPGLSSATITPASRSAVAPTEQTRDGPGSRVVFNKRLVGYACPSAIDGSFMLIDKEHQQVALLSRDGDVFRVCKLGASIEESMEFLAHPDLHQAIAEAYELPGAPHVDPPLEL